MRSPTQVSIEWGAPGALAATRRGDIIVMIDALRASMTIACALVAGASRVIPVLTIEEALALREQRGFWIAGERGGAKVADFDYGNSPTELLAHRAELNDHTLVLTTSNGTRCVEAGASGSAPFILAAAVPNAGVAARQSWVLASWLGCDITLLAAGLDDAPNDEDLFAARCLLQLLVDNFGAVSLYPATDRVSPEQSIDIFENSEAGRRLSALGYADDVRFCAEFDTLELVPVYHAGIGFVPLRADILELGDD